MSDDTLTAEKLAEIEARLRTYCDGIQGKNELKVGLLMCNDAMLNAADMLKAQAAEIERLTRERDDARRSSAQNREYLADAQNRAGVLIGRAKAAEAKAEALIGPFQNVGKENWEDLFDCLGAASVFWKPILIRVRAALGSKP